MKTKLFTLCLLLVLFLPSQVLASDRALNCQVDSTNVDLQGRVEVTIELDNTSTAFGGPFNSTGIVVTFNYSAGFDFFSSGPPAGITVSDNPGANTLTITINSVAAGAKKSLDAEFRALTAGSWGFNGSITAATPGDPDSSNNSCQLFVNAIQPAGPGSSGNHGNAGSVRDPISTFSGEFYNQFDADIDLGGPMGLLFSRYYGSMLLADGISTGVLGDNWRHNFEWSLSNSGTVASITSNRGASIEFTKSGALWNQSGFTNKKYQLVEDGGSGAFTLLDVKKQRFSVFNAAGLLTSVRDGRGNQNSMSYSGSGELMQVSDGVGRVLTYSYSASKLSSVSDGTRTVTFTHTGNDLTSSTSSLGNVTTYAYAAGGLMTSFTRPGGNTIVAQVYNAGGKVTSQTDGETNATSLSYSGSDTTITDALAAETIHTHTATGELSQIEDANGDVISITSNSNGLRSSVTDRLGEETSFTYHTPSDNLASRTDADGSFTSYSYTSRAVSGLTLHDRAGINHADGSTVSMAYDASGNLTSRTDQLGNTFAYTYNNSGQRLTSGFPIGGTTSFTYNADLTLASITGPSGNSTSFAYDGLRRPSVTTLADGTSRSFTFDNANRILTITDENNNTTSLSYDDNDNLQSTTTPLGETTTYAYNDNDQPISFTNPLGGVLNTTYNALGRVATFSDAGGNITTSGYDVLGQLISLTDPLGNVWMTSYNLEGLVSSRTNPLGKTTTLMTDTMGRITQTSSSLGNTSAIGYDSIGLISTTTDPLGNVTSFTRDATGFVTGIALEGAAVSTTYTRNEIGQRLRAEDPDGNNWNNAYDNAGRLVSTTDPLGNQGTASYNSRNKLFVVNYPATAGTMTLGYDAAENTTSRTYSDGTTLNYTYDANNRILTANGISNAYDANGRNTNSNGIATAYDAQGRIISLTVAAGKTVTYAYDANDRLTKIVDWAGGSTTFSYDAAGQLTAITRPNGVNRSNNFDDDSRLVSVTDGANLTISLIRDANDQILSAQRTAPQLASANSDSDTNNTFDAASQVASHNYDSLGRTTSAGSNSFVWNLASRLTSYTKNGITTSATYDGLGKRLSRTIGAATSNYVWSYALLVPSIVVEKQGVSDFRYFIRMPGGELLYSINASTNARSFYHFDEMGNTAFVSNDAGATTGSYAYSPFGIVTSSTGGLDNPFTWQGEMGAMDEGHGLYYIRARYYDAVSARFISRDPIQNLDPRAINPYQYAFNNPFKFIDITGRAPRGTAEVVNVVVAAADIPVISIGVNTFNLGGHLAEGDTDAAIEDAAGLAIDGGGLYLTAAAATAEVGAATGAAVATPFVIGYAGAKLGIVVYESWWDLQASEQRLEATIFATELNARKQTRIQAQEQARIAKEARMAHEKSEQREQKFRDENEARVEAERDKSDTSEVAIAFKFLAR